MMALYSFEMLGINANLEDMNHEV